MLPESPTKPLCKTNHPILRAIYAVKVSGMEIPIIDADFDICDNVIDPDLNPPLRCPLPPTYSGSMTSSCAGDIMKPFEIYLVRLP